jgi:uncharacterized damage-inducible protein DinB
MKQQWRTTRPGSDEHAPYYAGYIAAVPEGDLIETLERQLAASLATWRGVPEARGAHRYAEGKWSVKELINHVIDAERVFAYRVLRAARNDETALPGFDENRFAKASHADQRAIGDQASEFEHLRRGNIALFTSLDDEAAARRVTASGHPITARALMWVIAGHERHHDRVLRERYLSG